VYAYHILFTHLSIYWHLHLTLAVVNSAAINVGIQASPWYADFIFFGYLPKSQIARSYGMYILVF
jgi:hypothetical protein